MNLKKIGYIIPILVAISFPVGAQEEEKDSNNANAC